MTYQPVSPYTASTRDEPADCACGRPLAGDNGTGKCYLCQREDYWGQAEKGATEDNLERLACNRQERMENCGHIYNYQNSESGLMSKRVILCHQQDCENCLRMRAKKERQQLNKAMVDFRELRTLVLDSEEAQAFIRRLGRAGVTKDMRRRLPQEDGTTVFFFVSTNGKLNGKLGGRVVTIDDVIAYDFLQLARRPAGTRTSGALGAEPQNSEKDDRETLKIKAVSTSGSDEQIEQAREIADEAVAGIEAHGGNVEALCNKWASEYEQALREMGCNTHSTFIWEKCDLNAINWNNQIADNQPLHDQPPYTDVDYWLNAHASA